MSDAALSEIVRSGDPLRWRSAMAAPVALRPGLMAIYAFNLEIARAPWIASEPLLAEIRLQWWQDAVAEICAGDTPRRHQVTVPLAAAISEAKLPQELLSQMISARLSDAHSEPHADAEALAEWIDHTSGHLMVLAATLLGADDTALAPVRRFGRAAGYAAFLHALPGYQARGRHPLGEDPALPAVARTGLAELGSARQQRHEVPRTVLPALLPGCLAGTRLKRALADPACVLAGGLEMSEFAIRARMLATALSGRW